MTKFMSNICIFYVCIPENRIFRVKIF